MSDPLQLVLSCPGTHKSCWFLMELALCGDTVSQGRETEQLRACFYSAFVHLRKSASSAQHPREASLEPRMENFQSSPKLGILD